MAKQQENDIEQLKIQKLTLTKALKLIERSVRQKIMSVEAGDPYEPATNYWLRSLPGFGKTARIQKLSSDLGVRLQTIDAANLQQGDLNGVPVPLEDKEGNHFVTMLPINNYFPSPDQPEYNEAGILFLDEMTQADRAVRKELLKFCDGTTRYVNGKKCSLVPPAWVIVGSGNTRDTVGDDFEDFGFNVKARFASIEIYPDMNEFSIYMTSTKEGEGTYNPRYKCWGFHPLVISYLKDHENHLYAVPDVNFDENIANPRNWERISKECYYNDYVLEKIQELKNSDVLKKEKEDQKEQLAVIAKSLLGDEIGTSFLTFVDYKDKLLDVKELINKKISDTFLSKAKNSSKQIQLLSFYNAFNYIDNKLINENEDKKLDEAKIKQLQSVAYENILNNLGKIFEIELLSKFLNEIIHKNVSINVNHLDDKIKNKFTEMIAFEKMNV